MLNSKGFSSRILRGGWNTCKREIDITKGVGNKSQNELKIECGNEATSSKCSQGLYEQQEMTLRLSRVWRQETLHIVLIAHSQYTRDIVPPGLACQRLHLKYIFVENWATAVKTKNKWCVSVCFLLIFSVSVCESQCVMSSTETCSVFCWKIVNCTRNFLLIMQSAICASDHVSSSSLEAICCTLSTVRVRVTGQWGWVRGPGRFGPHRAWIFINFHNLCAGCEHCNNLSRSGCCPFAFMAARLFKY